MAGITPDPKKRGYLLPLGCKDLHDVLQREEQSLSGNERLRRRLADATRRAQKLAAVQDALRSPGAKPIEKIEAEWPLGELAALLTAVIESGIEYSWLSLTSPEPELEVSLLGGRHGGSGVRLSVEIGTDRNEAVREFCRRHHFPVPPEGDRPPRFRFNTPVYQLYELLPVPSGTAATAILARRLFEEVAGLTEEAPIRFCCVKMAEAG